MVKVAVCFSGTLRGFDACFPKIKTHFIEAWNIEPTYFFYGPKGKYPVEDVCKDIIFEYEDQTQQTILPVNPAGYGCPLEYFSWQWYNSKKSLRRNNCRLNIDINIQLFPQNIQNSSQIIHCRITFCR